MTADEGCQVRGVDNLSEVAAIWLNSFLFA